MTTIKIAIVDDHKVFREGLELLFESHSKYEIIFSDEDGQTLLKALQLNNNLPNIILMDYDMPKIDGISLCRKIKSKYHNLKIIMLSMHNSRQILIDSINAGANSYICKTSGFNEIINGIEKCILDEVYFPKDLKPIVSDIFKSQANFGKGKYVINELVFNETDIQVLKLICEEKSSEEIGDIIFRSRRTVDGIRAKLLEKTNSENSIGLVKFALKNDLIRI